jgi:hypothetical protein
VALRDGMLAIGLVDDADGLCVTRAGRSVLADLGVVLPVRRRRPLLKDCLDWTERREHLAGALPAALLDRALAAGWLVRDAHRAIRVTPAAGPAFELLGVDVREHRARSRKAPDAASAYR